MMRGETRDRKSGEAVTQPAFQDQAANERRWSSRSHAQHRRAASFFKHLSRGEWRITLADHAVMMRGVGRRVVQQISIQSFDACARIHRDRLVNVTFFPMTVTLLEEPQLSIRIPATAANPTMLVVSAPRDLVTIGQSALWLFAQLVNRSLQLIGGTLICVETEDPLVLCLFDCELLLRAKAGPCVSDHARSRRCSNFARRVGRVRVYHYNLVGPCD